MNLDLRNWLNRVEAIDELEVVHGADPMHEIGALSSLNYRRPNPLALLFDDIPGFPSGFRVLTGSLSNARRMGHTMQLKGVENDRDLIEVLSVKSREWTDAAPLFPAHEVASGAFQEHHQTGSEIDLSIFPTPTWHEGDGGPYIGTGNLCITTNPETGQANGGCCRVEVQDGGKTCTVQMNPTNDTGVNVARWLAKEGRAPMAISMGHDPLLLLVGGSPIPAHISELDYAGAVLGAPIEVVRGADTDMPIPVTSEIVVEGWLIEGQTMTEGPFGESKGYYSRVKEVQTMEISNVYYRDDPVILGSPPGKPPYDFSYFWSAVKSSFLFDSLKTAGVPGVRDVWAHETGRNMIVVAIEQQYAGHSRQAAQMAANCRYGAPTSKYVVVVDEDIDPRNLDEVAWAMCTRSDPEVDVEIMRKTWGSPEDPLRRDPTAAYMSRALIDACRPYGKLKTYPKVADYSRDLIANVQAKWPEFRS